MKKWLLPVTAATIVFVGCGGHGGGSSTTGTTTTGTTTTGDSIASVNVSTLTNGLTSNTIGAVNYDFLTGQGRAAGDSIAYIDDVFLDDSAGRVENKIQSLRALQLNGYSQQIITLDVPVPTTQDSRIFSTYDLEIASVSYEDSDGAVHTYPDPLLNQTTSEVSQTFPAQITAFRGRQSSLQIFLDDATLSAATGAVVFDRNNFLVNNTTSSNVNVQSFLGDYVMFDITNVASKPNFADGSGAATKVYFSGDSYAISSASAGGEFQVYTSLLTNPQVGTFSNNTTLTTYGTYTLQQSPVVIGASRKLTSLQGIWRKSTDAFANLGTFEVLLFPHTADDNNQDVIAMVRDANGNITNFYYGYADLTAKTFAVFPIADIETAATTGEIDGTLSGLVDVNNSTTAVPSSVRAGRYTFTGTLPTGFKTSGRFVDYRI